MLGFLYPRHTRRSLALIKYAQFHFKIWYGRLRHVLTFKKHYFTIDIESVVFLQLLEYCYLGEYKMHLSADKALHLHYASMKYMITKLTNLCRKFIECNLNEETVCSFLDQAVVYNDEELKNNCLDFLKNSCTQVRKKNMLEKYHFTEKTLSVILQDDHVIFNEADLFEYLSSWAIEECTTKGIDCSLDNKRDTLENLIHFIRIHALKFEQLAAVVSPSKLLSTKEELSLYRV